MSYSPNNNLKIPYEVNLNQKIFESLYESENTNRKLLSLLPHIVFKAKFDGTIIVWHDPTSKTIDATGSMIYEIFFNLDEKEWGNWIEAIDNNSHSTKIIQLVNTPQIVIGEYVCTLMKTSNSILGMLLDVPLYTHIDDNSSSQLDFQFQKLANYNFNDIIRTPLTTIDLKLQLLHEYVEEMDQKQCKETVMQIRLKLDRLVNDLKTLEMLEIIMKDAFLKKHFSLSPTKLQNFFNRLSEHCEKQFDYSLVNFDRPSTIRGCSNSFFHMLNCILINSQSAALSNISISVSKIQYTNTFDKLLVYLKDDGLGIDARNVANIFKAGWCDDMNLTRKTKKLGLGLCYVWNYVKLLQGECCVDSRTQLGTIFAIELPIIKN